MGYKKETTEDDLIMLPDIDGMIKDIKKQETVSQSSTETGVKNESMTQGNHPSDSWNAFLKCSEQYEYRVKQADRKVCHIDEEIHETLKMCDINKMSLTTLVNAILRAFIIENADKLRSHMTRKRSLI